MNENIIKQWAGVKTCGLHLMHLQKAQWHPGDIYLCDITTQVCLAVEGPGQGLAMRRKRSWLPAPNQLLSAARVPPDLI